jgi:hypothetical protein
MVLERPGVEGAVVGGIVLVGVGMLDDDVLRADVLDVRDQGVRAVIGAVAGDLLSETSRPVRVQRVAAENRLPNCAVFR